MSTLMDRICIRAKIDDKFGSYTLRELMDAGEWETVMTFVMGRIHFGNNVEALVDMMTPGSYVALKEDWVPTPEEEEELTQQKRQEEADNRENDIKNGDLII